MAEEKERIAEKHNPPLEVKAGKDEETRASINAGSTSLFFVGDRVWYDPGGSMPLEGPYLIASVPSTGKYTLCYDNASYDIVNNGQEVDESQLQRA